MTAHEEPAGHVRGGGGAQRERVSKCMPARVTTMGCNITRVFAYAETEGGEETERRRWENGEGGPRGEERG